MTSLGVTLACAAILALHAHAALAGAKQSPAKPAAKPAAAKGPVLIQAYYPLNSQHKYIADYLKQFAKAKGNKVKLEVYDTQTSDGRKAWTKTGLTCAGIFINGHTKWDTRTGKKVNSVDFIKKMDVFWQKKEFETVVNGLISGSASVKPAAEKADPAARSVGKSKGK